MSRTILVFALLTASYAWGREPDLGQAKLLCAHVGPIADYYVEINSFGGTIVKVKGRCSVDALLNLRATVWSQEEWDQSFRPDTLPGHVVEEAP